MATYVAVLDIGKTNKKLCIYDAALQLIASEVAQFPEIEGDHDLKYEDQAAIWGWFREQLVALYQRYPFAAIAVTTHGATYALLDHQGELTHPIVAYDSALPAESQRRLDQDFYTLCGPLASLQAETGSCDMPLLVNPAKSLLYLRQQAPRAIDQAAHLLNYPQYWGFLLTGVAASEATYTANHSFLFDIHNRCPSTAAHKLGVTQLLPPTLQRPWDALGTLRPELQQALGLPAIPVAVGIHDSNAALLPYLLTHDEDDFALNSTGTWCVMMHKVQAPHYRDAELEQKVIFNIDAFGDLHKTCFLMAGQDYALYHDLIDGDDPGFAAARVDAALAHSGNAILPGAFPSQFPGFHGGACEEDQGNRVTWSLKELATEGPSWFADPAQAHDYLNVALALQSKIALERIDIQPETKVFIEGGFRNNSSYLAVLAASLPNQQLMLTDLPQATSGGTAILALALAEGRHPQAYASLLNIAEKPVTAGHLDHLAAYEQAYRQRLTGV